MVIGHWDFIRMFKNYKITKLKIASAAVFIFAIFLVLFFRAQLTSATIISKSNSNNSLKNGLAGWWTMDGKDTTVTTVTDNSGNGNTATRNGTTTLQTGKLGQAMKLDGTLGTYLSTGNKVVSSTTFTISLWAKNSSFNNYALASRRNVGCSWQLGTNTTNRIVYYDCVTIFTGGTNITMNKWHHYVLVINGTVGTFYIDGVPDSGGNFSPQLSPASANNLEIGSAFAGLAGANKGSMDDVRIYSRVLSPAEIVQLYTMGGGKINKTDTTRPDLKSGLVGHWTMDGKDTTVTTAIDKSGNGNTGTRAGGTSLRAGKIGQAMKLDGSTGYLSVANSSSLNVENGDYSVSFWAKISVDTTTERYLYSKGTKNTNTSYFSTRILSPNKNIRFIARSYNNDSNYDYYDTNTVLNNPNAWYHFVMTFKVSTRIIKVYINGVEDGGATGSLGTTFADANTLSLELGKYANTGYFPGSLDDFRIYNRTLSATEVQQLYAMGGGKINKTDTTKPDLKSGLVGHWTMDGKDYITTSTLLDKSGNGNTGTRSATDTILVAGKIGQGMKFGGKNGTVSVANSASLSPTSSITISTWIKHGVNSTGSGIISKSTFLSDQGDYALLDIGGVAYFQFNAATQRAVTTGAVALATNKWTHVVATYNGTSILFYINGVLKTSTCTIGTCTGFAITSSTASLKIGTYYDLVPLQLLAGSLDDVRIYNRAISPIEVMQLYRMGY